MIKQDIVKTFCVNNHTTDIIIYPGYNGTVHGYNFKYDKIANLLWQKQLGTVIQSSNREGNSKNYPNELKNWLRYLITKRLVEESLTNTPRQVYLMGVSAGASACAAIAHEFPEVTKMLLIAPSSDAGNMSALYSTIRAYTKELYITVGDEDDVVGIDFPHNLYSQAAYTSKKLFQKIEKCDHQFRGKTNGMIFSKAPLWAFAGDNSYPDPEGGIELYE